MTGATNGGGAARQCEPLDTNATNGTESTSHGADVGHPPRSRRWRISNILVNAWVFLAPGVVGRFVEEAGARYAEWIAAHGRLEALAPDEEWIADQARLDALAAAILRTRTHDRRERVFCPVAGAVMVLDDGGGTCITLFDDGEACHLFLTWLHAKRAEKQRKEYIARIARMAALPISVPPAVPAVNMRGDAE